MARLETTTTGESPEPARLEPLATQLCLLRRTRHDLSMRIMRHSVALLCSAIDAKRSLEGEAGVQEQLKELQRSHGEMSEAQARLAGLHAEAKRALAEKETQCEELKSSAQMAVQEQQRAFYKHTTDTAALQDEVRECRRSLVEKDDLIRQLQTRVAELETAATASSAESAEGRAAHGAAPVHSMEDEMDSIANLRREFRSLSMS